MSATQSAITWSQVQRNTTSEAAAASLDHYRELRRLQIVAAIDQGTDGSVPYRIHSRPVMLIVVTRSWGPTTVVQQRCDLCHSAQLQLASLSSVLSA